MPRPRVPLFDTSPQYATLAADVQAAIDQVFATNWFILGEQVRQFEIEFAAYCGAAYAVGVGNGTDAIELALRAVGVGPGDEVITVGLTAPFTALPILALQATPVLVDVDPATLLLNAAALEAAIGPRTRAILPVNLYGRPCDLAAITAVARGRGLPVVTDCAQAHGAAIDGRRALALGDIAAFSFYPTKNLGAYGDAGAVVTDRADLADAVRRLRNGGMAEQYRADVPGRNSRLDELQAAVLRVKLPRLDGWNVRRRTIAARYARELRGIAPPPDVPGHVYHLYVVRAPARDALAARLAEQGIGTKVHYPWPVHLQPAFIGRCRVPLPLTHTEQACREILSLPIYPELTDEQVDAVVAAVNAFA
ncbi:MAG: DegT/DnrJ/EryC1/StrS family aminotransferase [Actinobacteria bacterium]|nr:DegT/DnrJ/EryC1/StrS family aminotransferase [Actinomycetota bacterium]